MLQQQGSKPFCAENLHLQNGGAVGQAINHAIRQAIRDVQDRPGDKASRKVGIVIELKPVLDDLGKLDVIDHYVRVKSVIPDRKNTEAYRLRPDPERPGEAIFVPTSPHDPRQVTFTWDEGTGEVIDDPKADAQ